MLIRQLISAKGMFGCKDNTARRVIASHLKMQGHVGSSPGTSFRISNTEIFLHTGVETTTYGAHGPNDPGSGGRSHSSSIDFDSGDENRKPSVDRKPELKNNAAQRLKSVLHWPQMKRKRLNRLNKSINGFSEEIPIPLRQRFSLPNNKRTLSVRSNPSSPIAKKKLVSEVTLALPQVTIPKRSRSSSFSKSFLSSPSTLDKQKRIFIEKDIGEPSGTNSSLDYEKSNINEKQGSTRKGLKRVFLFWRFESDCENRSLQVEAEPQADYCKSKGMI